MSRIILIYLFVFFSFCSLFSQELYLKSGKNFTNYDYLNSSGLPNETIKNGTGNFYELGYNHYFNSCRCSYYRFYYSVSFVLNDFNAVGGNKIDIYTWNTQYAGLQGMINFNTFPDNELNIIPKFGINISSLLNGNQSITGVNYNLAQESEFKGVFISPVIGLDLKYSYSNSISFVFGYSFSKSFKFSNSDNEKLSFVNKQIQFGFCFNY